MIKISKKEIDQLGELIKQRVIVLVGRTPLSDVYLDTYKTPNGLLGVLVCACGIGLVEIGETENA